MTIAVKALYMGGKDGSYRVNVRNASPTGLIGDAGVIRTFKSEKEAKAYAREVNATGVDTFVPQKEKALTLNPVRHAGDEFVPSKKAEIKPSVTLNEQGNEVTVTDETGEKVVLYGPAEEGRPYVDGMYNGHPVKLTQGDVIRLLLSVSAQETYKNSAA